MHFIVVMASLVKRSKRKPEKNEIPQRPWLLIAIVHCNELTFWTSGIRRLRITWQFSELLHILLIQNFHIKSKSSSRSNSRFKFIFRLLYYTAEEAGKKPRLSGLTTLPSPELHRHRRAVSKKQSSNAVFGVNKIGWILLHSSSTHKNKNSCKRLQDKYIQHK